MNETSVDPGLMRASDLDRDLAIADLRDGCQMGRLTVDEFEARMHGALCSATVGQLWSLTSDLPRRAQPVPAIGPARAPGPWGAPLPYYPPAPWGYGLPSPSERPRMHPLAVTAFVVSIIGVFMCQIFVTSTVAAAFAIFALRQIDTPKPAYAGRGLAIAALAISVSSVFLGVEIFLHR